MTKTVFAFLVETFLPEICWQRCLYFWFCIGRRTRHRGWLTSWPWRRWGEPKSGSCCIRSSDDLRMVSDNNMWSLHLLLPQSHLWLCLHRMCPDVFLLNRMNYLLSQGFRCFPLDCSYVYVLILIAHCLCHHSFRNPRSSCKTSKNLRRSDHASEAGAHLLLTVENSFSSWEF